MLGKRRKREMRQRWCTGRMKRNNGGTCKVVGENDSMKYLGSLINKEAWLWRRKENLEWEREEERQRVTAIYSRPLGVGWSGHAKVSFLTINQSRILSGGRGREAVVINRIWSPLCVSRCSYNPNENHSVDSDSLWHSKSVLGLEHIRTDGGTAWRLVR